MRPSQIISFYFITFYLNYSNLAAQPLDTIASVKEMASVC
jgi:hypothetical protein